MRNVRIASGTTQPETRCTPHGRYVPPVIEEGSGHMTSIPRHPKTALLTAALAGVAVIATGCSSSGGGGSTKTSGVTITVALATTPPPQASLNAFTASTGIKVNWSNTDWDSLQTKIAAAATAKTYFADATDVDWSRVGELGKLNWFLPMEKYMDTASLTSDMPQITSFTSGGHVVGIPYDASFLVTTVNKTLFTKAGITTMPTTIADYTTDLQSIKDKGVVQYPLNIPFAAAEGLSTYWYQTTAAFGGSILDGAGKPQFSTPDSAGFKAAQWMVDALKKGLVPPGNINVADSQGQQTLMAKGTVASTFGDYSGNVGSLYDIPESSSVVNQISYVPTPGVSGVGPNMSNPDGIGIPRQAKYPAAAAKFIAWFTEAQNQADFAGVNGPSKTMVGYFLPSRLTGMTLLTNKGALVDGAQLADMLKNSAKPVFPQGAPSWYPEFSRAVYTNLHAAAAGSMSVADAIKAISDTANKLASGS
jgi:multiple sugar transport system substrate-binding protein